MSDALPPAAHPDVPDLLHGGLLYRVLQKFGVDPEVASRGARRAALAGLLLWVPMAVAAFLDGTALPGRVGVPFLFDVAAYVRPLVVVPLLLASEAILAKTWRDFGALLRRRGVAGPECRDAYDALVDRVTRAVQRFVPEMLCLAIAGYLAARLAGFVVSAPRDAWYAVADGPASSRLTFAGAWAAFVVHALLFYLTFRWLWLFSLWYRFLFGVSRLSLHLFPAHPDRAAGLGVVGRTIPPAAPLLFAWSASLASVVANRMIHSGESLTSFAPVGIVLLVVVLVVFVLPPALIFLPLLVRTRRAALEEWSRRMARRAEASRPGAAGGTEEGDGGDAESLEDLSIAVAAVRGILPFPVALYHLVVPLAATAAPAIPLLFLALPVDEIFEHVARLLF